jgi:hypothetical protein
VVPPPPPKKISSAKLDRARAKLKVNAHDLDAWEAGTSPRPLFSST